MQERDERGELLKERCRERNKEMKGGKREREMEERLKKEGELMTGSEVYRGRGRKREIGRERERERERVTCIPLCCISAQCCRLQ